MFTISSTVLRAQFFVEFVFNSIALLIQINLLYRICSNGLFKQLSANLLINIVLWIIVSAAGALHTGYMIHFFAFEPYWGPAVLWTGSSYYAALTCLSISIFFLLLERIYSLDAPVSFNRNRKLLVRLTIGIIIGVGLFVQFVSPLREPVDEVTLCPVFTCLLVRYRGYLMAMPRIICCFLNVYLAFVCWRKILAYQRTGGSQKNSRRSHYIAIIAITTELLLNFTPTVIYLSLQFFVVEQWRHVGTFSFIFFSTDALVTAILYHFVVVSRWSKLESNSASPQRQAQRFGSTRTFRISSTLRINTLV